MNSSLLSLHSKSRKKKYRLFTEVMRPSASTRILNVGATGTTTGLADQLESSYPYQGNITGGGINLTEVQDYRRSFPEVRAVMFNGCALPFPDQSFDIVYSNAVLEHLPGEDLVQRFAAEVQRVGKAWFVTTPNFWYPFDPHYHLPFVQLLSQDAQRALVQKLGKTPYDYLHLFSKRELRRLFPTSNVIGCRVTFYPETLIAYRAP
jgi:ubiquinone/menaquinone biosynthesis C-methylase UbiE